jgi:PAS domain S-box-containing protein
MMPTCHFRRNLRAHLLLPAMPFSRLPTALAEALFQQAPEFLALYDVARRSFLRVNAAGARLLGYASEAEFLAAPAPLSSPAFAPADWARLTAATLHASPQEVDTELTMQDGRPLPVRLTLSSFQAENPDYLLLRLGQPGRLQQAERALAQSVRRFEAVVTNATIGIIVCNRTGSILSANQMAHQQFGYPEGELLQLSIDALVPRAPGRRHEQLRESFNTQPAVRSMGAHRGDLEGQRRDGSVFPVEVSLSYFTLDEELFVVSYVLDTTAKRTADQALLAERQRVEALNAELEQKVADRTQALLSTLAQLEQRQSELAQALAAEQELGELKSRFVSMASHEFRTPLTAVLTSASLIEKYPAAEQQDKRVRHLERIRASVTHLNDILEEFLSVGRIEEGKVEARPARIYLPTLLHEAIVDAQGLRKAGQVIEQHIDCSGPLWLDPSLLRKILVNLLSNALKYSAENTVVTVRAHCHEQLLTLSVQDQGVGISPEDQEHLFERFFRARNVTNVPGTGLGLYIIARYLELLGGTIALRSELGRGTTVTITGPYENHPAN